MSNPLPLPEQSWLHARFSYNPETGVLLRDGRSCGIDQVWISGHRYATARIIWRLITGEEHPVIEHWDGNQRNHRWGNLRAATLSLNGANTVRPVGRTGHRGVSLNNTHGREHTFEARIRVDGRLRSLGTFKTLEEAIAARLRGEEQFQRQYALRNRPSRA